MDLPSAAPPSGDFAEALFAPRAVALVGVSDDPLKSSSRPLPYLRKHGFPGAIYPINPQRPTVGGERAYGGFAELPGPVDHAFVLVGTERVEAAIADCAAAGVKVATILADGFAEQGPEGAVRQRRLLAVAKAGGMRLVGPNSLGVIDVTRRMALTANAALARDALLPGRLALLSQSGSLLGTFVSRGAARRIGFSKLISVGNEADLTVGEIGAAIVADPGTDAFLLFLETIRRPEELARFAALAHDAGKPILAYKLGRSAVGQELAVSHTGALVGSDLAADAFFRHHGIIRVDQFETLLEMPPLVIGRRPPDRSRASLIANQASVAGVGVVTTTGGAAAMVVDRLGLLEVPVVAPSAATRTRLASAGIAAPAGRILDLTLAGTRPTTMRAALEALLDAPEFAAIVAVVGSSAQFQPELAVGPIIDCARRDKPLAAFIVPEANATLGLLAAAGVAAFRTPEACADAIRSLMRWRAAVAAAARPPVQTIVAPPGGVLDERQSHALFERLGIACAPSIVLDADRPDVNALPFGFPVAAKILSPEITHKTDADGVTLDIATPETLARRAAAMVGALRQARPMARLSGVLVQPMVRGIAEMLLGYRDDSEVGPIVTIGMGGILAELYRDVAVRLAPVDEIEATAMVDELRGIAAIRGYRGRPAGDLAALTAAICRFSRLADFAEPRIAEAEINPLIIKPAGEGVVAVDGVVRFAAEEG
jgi:acyl-CoA synthetase (NDP forming)